MNPYLENRSGKVGLKVGRPRAVPRRMRNDYRVKQGLPKRVDVVPPPVCWPLPHHLHLTKNLLFILTPYLLVHQ
jgi:hypothetical protein